MPIVSVSVDEATRKKMKQHNHLNWSAVARDAFNKKIQELELFEELCETALLSEKALAESWNSKEDDEAFRYLQ